MKISTLRALPLILLFLVVITIALGLFSRGDPARMSSPIVGKSINFFDMPMVIGGQTRFTPRLWEGQIAIIHFFASWCESCLAEQPMMNKLATEARVPMYGVAWRDKNEPALRWLRAHGNPYQAVGLDEDGKSAIAFGVSGVPETLVVDASGIVRYSYRAPLTEAVIAQDIIPLVEQLRSGHATPR